MDSLLAITNRTAGSADAETIDQLLTVLRKSWEVAAADTSSPEELAEALDEHRDVKVVAALGGDGSIHAVVAALYEAGRLPDTAVAVIPLGTGNDFARTLDLPEDPVAATEAVATGTVRPIDLVIDGRNEVVVNAAHVGLGAEAAAKARPYKKFLGPIGYAVGALISGFTTPGSDVRVEIDGEPLEPRGKVAQVAVGNGRFVGGGAELLPDAIADDGLLDVAVSYASPMLARLRYAWTLLRGTHTETDLVVYRHARKVRVTGEELRCTSDGELTERLAEHSWEIKPGGLRMLLPAD